MNNLLKLFLILTIFFVLVDPGNLIFGLKEISLFLLFVIWLGDLIIKRSQLKFSKSLLIHLLLFSFVIPITVFFSGYYGNSLFKLADGLQYIKAFLFTLTVFIVIERRFDFYKYFSYVSLTVALISIYLYFSIEKFSLNDNYYFVIKNAAFISRRAFGDILLDPVIFYKTSPLLIISLSYFCELFFLKLYGFSWRRLFSFISILLLTTTLIISGTRANWICTFLIIVVFVGIYFRTRNRNNFHIYIISLLFLCILIVPPFLKKTIFTKTEESNAIKINHLNSYITHFKQNPRYLIIGQGFGTYFYSKGVKELTQQTELTYLEIIRMMGIPIALMFLFLLIWPVFSLINSFDVKNFGLIFSYLLYLFEIGTNPLLFGSTGMLVFVLILSKLYEGRYVKD